MTKFKIGDKVRNNFPLTNGGGASSEAAYETTYGQIGEIVKIDYNFYLVKFKNFKSPIHFMESELVLVPEARETIPACDLEIGQMGRIISNNVYSGAYVGDVVLRICDGIVSLNDPQGSWDLDVPFYVEKFNSGEEFKIVAR